MDGMVECAQKLFCRYFVLAFRRIQKRKGEGRQRSKSPGEESDEFDEFQNDGTYEYREEVLNLVKIYSTAISRLSDTPRQRDSSKSTTARRITSA